MKGEKLVFVYNADSDLFSSVTDFAHKILSPATYACSLCALTYGNLRMKQEWRDFVEQLPVGRMFLHRDEFLKQYGMRNELPAIFWNHDGRLEPFLSSADIRQCQSLQELMGKVSTELEKA